MRFEVEDEVRYVNNVQIQRNPFPRVAKYASASNPCLSMGLLEQTIRPTSNHSSFLPPTSYILFQQLPYPSSSATLRLGLKDELPHILIIRHVAVDGLADLLRGFLAVSLDPFFVPLFFCFDLSSLFVCMLSVV
jgi:hypothetical protein